MLKDYLPILIMVGAVVGFGIVNLIISELLGAKRRVVGKGQAYECGMAPAGDARMRLSIHFYLVAVLFILFDVESLLLLPWAVSAKAMTAAGVGMTVFAEISAFVVVLALGLGYVWKKGGLTWDR
jgi:NADH-quinone oxidoreductase subunit A